MLKNPGAVHCQKSEGCSFAVGTYYSIVVFGVIIYNDDCEVHYVRGRLMFNTEADMYIER